MKSRVLCTEIEIYEKAISILQNLQFPLHRVGFKQLAIAISLFSKDNRQSMSKEIYPIIANYWNCSNWRNIEHSIRIIILDAWIHRDREEWDVYFPGIEKAPSNKCFIATIATFIELHK